MLHSQNTGKYTLTGPTNVYTVGVVTETAQFVKER